MLKMTHFDLAINTGSIIYVTVDVLKFSFDQDTTYATVELETNGEYEFLEEIKLKEFEVIVDHDDLQRVALNWIFKNVEIVEEV